MQKLTESNMKYIIAILYLLSSCALGVEAQTSFHRVSDCVCSGDIVTYRCTVCGGVATVWEGSAFDCDSNGDEVSLSHRNFGTSASFRECNSGRIVGQGLSVDSGCYISQLNVTFEPGLQNRTVVCSVDDGTQSSEVGCDVLRMSTEPLQAPTVSVQEVNQTEIVFSWNQTHHCPSLFNDILPSNCGVCPNTTTGTWASCVNFTTSADVKVCEFRLRVVTCGNSNLQVRGHSSTPVLVNLTVPRVPQVLSVPHYLLDGRLRGLTIGFAEVAPFIVYEGINGSIESYTVTYSDADSGALCGSQTISDICSNEICNVEFNVSSSMCPQSTDNINVSVTVTTNLGDGPKSDPITEEYQNIFVMVEVVAQTASIDCTFPGMISGAVDYSCNATIIYGPTCLIQTNLTGEIINSVLISIGLRSFLEQTGKNRYCGFVANVKAGEKTLTVEGNIDFVTLLNGGINGATIAAAVTLLAGVILMSIVVITPAFLFWRNRRIRKLIVRNVEMSLTKNIHGIATPLTIPKMYRVDRKCNMIEFAKEIRLTYKPDSGTGYFQLQRGSSEYISATTEVVLINEDKTEMCAGPEARDLLGFHDRRQPISIPESFPWKYVFIQSTSRIRMLPKGTYFIFYPEPVHPETSESDPGLKIVRRAYYRVFVINRETTFGEIHQKKHKDHLKEIQNPELMQYFYEFTVPGLLPYSKQVILMGKNEKLYHGPGVRRELRLNREDYDDAEIIQPPTFPEDSRWTRVFLHSTSRDTILKQNTRALFCTVGSTIMIEVIEPFEIFKVTEEDENSRNLFKFARERIPDYNEISGYSYYEFTKRSFVVPWRNVMALNKNGKLYTGPAVHEMIGAPDYCDDMKELDPPDFSESDWECVFLQGTSYDRILERNTRFLYCEYDYNPK